MLQDWDEQRRVVRPSKYANFFVEEKLEFLSTLSFELTIEHKTVRFRPDQLEEIYRKIAPRFGLPAGEAAKVAREIETHTGIIVESGGGFEFSHLSLQEYLCGYNLVRQPQGDRLMQYLREYPAPVAVAVALSSDPSAWFASLVLDVGGLKREWPVQSFLVRLTQERPWFTLSEALGHAILGVLMSYPDKDSRPFEDLLRVGESWASVALALKYYRVVRHANTVSLLYESNMRAGQSFRPRVSGVITKELFDQIIGKAVGDAEVT